MSDFQKDIKWRINLVYLCVLLVALAIVLRMFFLIFIEGEKWRSRAENKTIREVEVQAKRGDIYSADSSILVMTKPVFTVRMDLHETVVSKDTFNFYVKALADSLSAMFPGKSSQEYLRLLKASRNKDLGVNPNTQKHRGRGERNFLIARNIDYSALKRIQDFPILKKGKNRGGMIVEEQTRRVVLHDMLAARTIGYYNVQDSFGVGLEAAYNAQLRGKSGKRIERKIANGVWRPVYRNQFEPEDGKDIITTLDMRIQDVAEAALMRCLKQNDADHGCAILMEVETGAIRAIANLKRGRDSVYREVENFAVGESVEPGSTFKLATLIAILEEGKMDTGTIVPTGKMQVADRVLRDSREEGYGDVSLKRAFEVSSNVGMAYAVRESFQNNPKKFTDYLYKMRLDKPLGLEIPGEGRPYVKNPKDNKDSWSGVSLAWMSMGYELLLTPLQQLALYNAIANNGKMMKPMFVTEIRSGGQTVERFSPVVLENKICSDKTIGKVKGCLESVVESGTAKSLSRSPYKIAGKTGTAQINYSERGVNRMSYRASFIGYFPADNPKYTCLVIVSNPGRNRKYGGEVAAPVFKDIADKVYATRLNMMLDLEDVEESCPQICLSHHDDVKTVLSHLGLAFDEPDDGSEYWSVRQIKDNASVKGVHHKPQVIPNVVGMNAKDAVFLLENLGLKVMLNGRGLVREQSINAGIKTKGSETIWLRLS